MKGKLLYRETQTFRGIPFIALIVFTLVAILGPIYYSFFNQIVLGVPTGDQPMSDQGLLILTFAITLIVAGILAIVYFHKLVIEIDEGQIKYSFSPYFLSPKIINQSQLAKAYIRKYSPITEYGGWGYRWGFRRGRAYNIWGNKGLQLEFIDGKKLLLGTQKSGELHRVIEKWMNKERNG